MSRFKIDINKLGLLLLPTSLRKPLLYAYTKAVAAPLRTIYSAFMSARERTLFALQYDSSVYNIERYLNIVFSDGGEAIYITLADNSDTAYLTKFVPFTLYDPDAYGPVSQIYLTEWLGFYLDAVERGVDFVVHIPAALSGQRDNIAASVRSLALPSYAFQIVEY